MADELVAICWAQRRSAGDFAATAQAALDAAGEPAQRTTIASSLVAQLLDAACVGEKPSPLLIDYLEHGMMLGALPINLSLQQLLACPLLAVETPVRLRALLPVLHTFAPYVTPDNEEAAKLVLQILIKLTDIAMDGVAGNAAVNAARALLGGQAVLPLIALGRHVWPDVWQTLLERLRRQREPVAFREPLAVALTCLGLRLEDDTRIPVRIESLALHDEDMGSVWTKTGSARPMSCLSEDVHLLGDDDGTVEKQRRVRARLVSWADCKIMGGNGGSSGINVDCLPRKRAELQAMVNHAMVSALSSVAADGQKTSKAFGKAVCNTVSVLVQRVCSVFTGARAVPWHEARALSQLLVATVRTLPLMFSSIVLHHPRCLCCRCLLQSDQRSLRRP